MRAIPVLDDLRDPLDSLVRWDGLTGAQLADELSQSLQLIASLIAQHNSEVLSVPLLAAAGTITALPSAGIAQQAGDLATALQALKEAVEAADNAALTIALGQAQAAATALQGHNTTLAGHAPALLALQQTLLDLPGVLQTRMSRLQLLLSPRATWADYAEHAGMGELPTVNDQALAPLTQLFGRVQESCQKLLDLVDVSTVLAPVTNTVTSLHDGVAQLEQTLVQLTSTAHAQFAQAKTSIDGIGLGAVATQAESALDGAVKQVQDALDTGFAPVAAALQAAMAAIDSALGSFDPEQLTAPIRDALAAIQGLFEGPEVQQALDQLKQLKSIAAQLDQLSFAPVADEVISAIDAIKSALSSIDSSSLPAPMPELIHEALAVLPTSIKPLTDPLITELANLIEQGPVPLLGELKDLPKPLFDQIRALNPQALLGDALGQPFQALRATLADFQPDRWLDAIEQELGKLRDRIKASANPKSLLQPLTAAFDAFMQQLEQFKPSALLAPINFELHGLLKELDGILPDLGFVADLQAILARIQSISGLLTQMVAVARHAADKAKLVSDPAGQLNQWLDEIFAKLQDVSAVQASLQALALAVEAAKAPALASAWQSASAPLRQALTQADARTRHTLLVTRRNALAAALAKVAAPAAPVQAVQGWLNTFSPAAPPFANGLLAMTQLQDALSQADAGMASTLGTWDARYHPAGGVLHSLVPADATADGLRESVAHWVREALARQLGQPVIHFLQYLGLVGQVLDTFTTSLNALSQAIASKLAAVLAAPQALLDTYSSMQGLLKRLSELDLGALLAEVDALYQALLGQARALDPRALEKALSAQFDSLLGTLSLSKVMTPALRGQINGTYRTLVQKLDALDPQLLLVEPMQSLYEQDIVPLLDVFDISDTVAELVAFLGGLDEQLSAQMDRVDTAFQAMLAAAPGHSGSGTSAGVGL
jgi:hypothetical protein